MRVMLWLISALLLAVGCTTTTDDYPSGEVSIAYLWSYCKRGSTPILHDLAIRGRVVANDKMGEVSHCIVVDDGTAGIKILVESDYIDDIVPLYSEVSILCSGLYLGRENGHLVMGQKPTGDYVVDRLNDLNLSLYIQSLTTPTTPPTPLRRTISSLSAHDILRYVEIDNLRFVESGRPWLDYDSLSTPQHSLRHLTDGHDTLRVAVHPSAVYGSEELPEGNLNCLGIIENYRDTLALRIIHKQAIRQ